MRTVFIGLFILLSRAVEAQENWFVLVHTGSVDIAAKKSLSFGMPVAADASITVGPESYVAFFSESGNVAEFEFPGTYQLAKVKPAKRTWAGFSASEIIRQNRFADIDDKYITPTVCASVPMADLLCEGGYFLESDTVRITWKRMSQDSLFTLFIMNIDRDAPIYSAHTTRNEITLAPEVKAKLEVSENDPLYATLQSQAYHAETDMILQYVSLDSNEGKWRMEMDAVYPEFTAPGCLLKALCLLNHRFPFAAEQRFRRAVMLKPAVRAYRDVYRSYKKAFEHDCH